MTTGGDPICSCGRPAPPPTFADRTTPHRCPVCNGAGLVSIPPGMAGDIVDAETFVVTSEAGPWPCQPCGGAGVLWR